MLKIKKYLKFLVLSIPLVLGMAYVHSAEVTAVPINNYVGEWEKTKAYSAGNFVKYQNATYIALVSKNNVNKAPGLAASVPFWQILGSIPPAVSTTSDPISQADKIYGTYRVEVQSDCLQVNLAQDGSSQLSITASANGFPIVQAAVGQFSSITGRLSSVLVINPRKGTIHSTRNSTFVMSEKYGSLSVQSRNIKYTYQIDKSTDTLRLTSQTMTWNLPNDASLNTMVTTDAGNWQTSDNGITFNNVVQGRPLIYSGTKAVSPTSEIVCTQFVQGHRISTSYN